MDKVFAPFTALVAFALRNDRRERLIALVVAVLGVAFLAVAILSYGVSRERLRDQIVSSELPLTSAIVYAEIERDFDKSVAASSLMANDTFLRDWSLAGETDLGAIEKFLNEMQKINSAFTAYFVSDTSHHYYIPRGVLKTVSRTDAHDGWFFALENAAQPYVVEVDTDQTHDNALTVFINYRVFDYANRFIGVAGIGLNEEAVRSALDRYHQEYGLQTYFVDRAGKVVMSGGDRDMFSDIRSAPGLSQLATKILGGASGAMEYAAGGKTHLLHVRYLPELNWYLFVERTEEDAMSNIRRTLYINLLIAAVATAVVASLLAAAAARYRTTLDKLSVTDGLTNLTNRLAFAILFRQAVRSSRRANRQISLALFDIDHVKLVNEKHGYISGDETIKAVAEVIEANSGPADVVCRWGGEEILVLLQDCTLNKAMGIADRIRSAIERLTLRFDGQATTVTVSAGVAEIGPHEGEDAALARADEGLQTAKREGCNRVISTSRF